MARTWQAAVVAVRRPFPTPPAWLRRGPFREGAWRSSLRTERLTAQLGVALGIAVGICFVTGLISHEVQHPMWFGWPSRPVSLYRITQGLHVASGLAAVPLLLAKLASAYHWLFQWPPVRDLAHAVERVTVGVLVGSVVFQLVTGVLNISLWYGAMPFFFTVAHYWTAWIAVGAIVIHIGVKLPVIRRALVRRDPRGAGSHNTGPRDAGRRGVLVGAAAAVGVVTLATVGQTVRPLSHLSVLAPRRPDIGPQRLPVNKTAVSADVVDAARDPGYRLVLRGPAGVRAMSVADLEAMPQHTVRLPIACVEGWSADAEWTGVRLADLLDLVGTLPEAVIHVESLQRRGGYRASEIGPPHSRDPLTLVALRLAGEPLHLDHGYPCRLIAPNRPGVLQTKWLARITAGVPE
ncbi:MAG: molybdopterin-dependent oxidoreductase [Micromonosporaceae bacterium]